MSERAVSGWLSLIAMLPVSGCWSGVPWNPLPHDAVASDGRIEQFDQVVDAVKRVVRKSGTRTRNVVAALPASVVIAKKVVLPEEPERGRR